MQERSWYKIISTKSSVIFQNLNWPLNLQINSLTGADVRDSHYVYMYEISISL